MRSSKQRKSINVLLAAADPRAEDALRDKFDQSAYNIHALDLAKTSTLALEPYEQSPDLFIISGCVEVGNSLPMVARFRKQFPALKIICSGLADDPEALKDLRRSGVDGFLAPHPTREEWDGAIHAVMAGGCFLSSALADCVFSLSNNSSRQSAAYGLTTRELEILALLTNGFSNKEIAKRFDLSVRTVETHRLNIRRKTKSKALSDLVRVARKSGIGQIIGSAVQDEVVLEAAE